MPRGRPGRPKLLQTRRQTHGSFEKNANISQAIKRVLRDADYLNLKPVHTEALDMIALKISRIVSGHADFADHWADIAGYANLGKEAV